MIIFLKIKRQNDTDNPFFYQTFSHECEAGDTVAKLLCDLNSREVLKDINGSLAPRIIWECGCLQKKCGACAMLINGIPRLACASFISDCADRKSGIVLEPLSKFPVIADLKVDRSILFENMKRMRLWLEEDASISYWERGHQYQASRCLMCGCCLEICPNFRPNHPFSGALTMSAAYKLLEQSGYGEHRDEILMKYRKYVFEGCGKSLSCQQVCPVGIPLEDLLVKTNGMAVWKRL